MTVGLQWAKLNCRSHSVWRFGSAEARSEAREDVSITHLFISQAELNSTNLRIVLKFLEVEVTLSCFSKKLFVNLESLCFVL